MSLCERCSLLGRTCCQGTDVYVTIGDIRRILTLVRDPDFFEFRRSDDPAYEQQDGDPVWARHVIWPDHTRRVLRHGRGSDCIFLSQTGCRLPLDRRPLVCRLHPHVYSAEGISPDHDPGCPVHLLEQGRRLQEEIAGFGAPEALSWHRMLYTEIQWENPADEDRPDLRFEKRVPGRRLRRG